MNMELYNYDSGNNLIPELGLPATRIVATLSDLMVDTPMIQTLFDHGMRIARLNSAHQTPEKAAKLITAIRKVSKRIAIMIDTKGPEIRTTILPTDLLVTKGQKISMGGTPNTQSDVPVNYSQFATQVKVNSTILIDDGAVELRVDSISDQNLQCTVLNDGVIRSNKSINVPGAHLNLPALTPKDREFLKLAAEQQVEFIAHSFVRNKHDLQEVRDCLREHGGSRIQIISKIENQEGVDNIIEIVENSWGILVARGDLGVEIPPEQVPVVQKHLINTCILFAKPVIVATQMLESMIKNPRPTRAEISDVANAVFDGADAVMLSGETAYGKYPVEAVDIMMKIIKSAENESTVPLRPRNPQTTNTLRPYLVRTAVKAANDLNAKALVIPSTQNGNSVREASSYRQKRPIYAMCKDPLLFRQLMLCYGVEPFLIDFCKASESIPCALNHLVYKNFLNKDDLIVMILSTAGSVSGAFNQMHINQVGSVLEAYRDKVDPAKRPDCPVFNG
jgi:pyruvate kinase